MTFPQIPITSIDIMPGRRRLDPAWVETLSDLFSSQGQLSPIEVIADGERHRLVFGHHRLAAAKLIGWAEIGAVVKDAHAFTNEAEIALREISENLARRELSTLDRAVDIARWREVYEAVHVIAKRGRKAKTSTPDELTAAFAVNFSVAAQKVFKLSERSIFNAVKVASIPFGIRDQIALHAIADNQSELLRLAEQPAERQAQITALLTAEEADKKMTVAEAIAIIDGKPEPAAKEPWLKVSAAFFSLDPADRDRVYQLDEAGIRLFLQRNGFTVTRSGE